VNISGRTGRIAVVPGLLLSFFLYSSTSFADKDDKDKDLKKHYGLIFGTAYGPDDQPLYGVKVEIHPIKKKNPHWERFSDHQGEFAVRVPPGPADYLVSGEVEIVPLQGGKPQKKKKIKAERTVHIESEERQDIGLHLAE
jgi:hypothetical protein